MPKTLVPYRGRKQPYTEIGIVRLPCSRCGQKPSRFQWNCCANGNRWLPVCKSCDIALNRVALAFFGFDDVAALMAAYEANLS